MVHLNEHWRLPTGVTRAKTKRKIIAILWCCCRAWTLPLVALGTAAPGFAGEFHVNVGSIGSLNSDPIVTFKKALEIAQYHRKAAPADTIVLDLPPKMWLDQPLVITSADSGTVSAPLVVRGAVGSGTIISGAADLPTNRLNGAANAIAMLIPAGARDRVLTAALGRFGQRLSPAMTPRESSMNSPAAKLALYQGEERMKPSRWPADRYATNAEFRSSLSPKKIELRIPEDAPRSIAKEENLWLAGYWKWNWWYEIASVYGIDSGMASFPMPASGVSTNARYFFSNVASALERPATYYFDDKDDIVYFVPKLRNAGGDTKLSVSIAKSLLRVVGAAHVRIENIAFEKAFGTAVMFENSQDVMLRNCFVGHTGESGIVIEGGADDVVERCFVSDTGSSGIYVYGGDPRTLTPSRHSIRHTLISNFGVEMPVYQPGVALEGVGNSVEECEITEGPHSAIIFGGNDGRIVGNIIHNVALDTSDVGAIYSGRDWTARGNTIASNYIFDIHNHVDNSDAVGVYLDDQLSGTNIFGNVFEDVDLPIIIGGGRDNMVTANLILAAKSYAIAMDARGLSWQKQMALGFLRKNLEKLPYQEPPWSTRYPTLVGILDQQPGAPEGNVISDNIVIGTPLVKYDALTTKNFVNDENNIQIVAAAYANNFLDPLGAVPNTATKIRLLIETRYSLAKTSSVMNELRKRWGSMLRRKGNLPCRQVGNPAPHWQFEPELCD